MDIIKRSFKTFLSHKYEACKVNTYFYEIFDEAAEVQFDVDEGKFATTVTRLERMIRNADAFIGIYTLPDDAPNNPTQDYLLESAKYFKLELDIAIRNKKAGIVFVDERFGTSLTIPPQFDKCKFSIAELTGAGGSPKKDYFRRRFNNFCDLVYAFLEYRDFEESSPRDSDNVAFIIPHKQTADAYSKDKIDFMVNEVAEYSKSAIFLEWPPKIDAKFLEAILDCDYAVVHLNEDNSIIPFLHGLAIPSIRLWQNKADENIEDTDLYRTLYSSQAAGYPKDIIKWNDFAQLQTEFKARLLRIHTGVERLNTLPEARSYFGRAVKRKESIFVSYSGDDIDFVQPLLTVLRLKFQTVFDYKDNGDSLEPGKDWMEQLFKKLSKCKLSVLLLSNSYFKSGNCKHEAQRIYALKDSGAMQVFPIKLYDDKEVNDEFPEYMKENQYYKYWLDNNAEKIIGKIEALLPEKDIS